MGKGQVSLFMILGVVLVVIAIFLFVFFTDTPFEPGTTITPRDDLTPVQVFVDRCIEEHARLAIQRAGVQGGYATLPQQIEQNPTNYLSFPRGSSFKTPYWQRAGQNFAPSLTEVETGIEQEIQRTIPQCLENLDELQGHNITAIDDPLIDFSINQDDVVVTLSYSVTTQAASTQSQQQEFSVALPIKLTSAFTSAYHVLEKHMEDPFLARQTLDLMVLDAENIPVADFRLSCNELRWNVRTIQDRLKELLYYNIPRIRVQNTQHVPFQSTPQDYARFAHITIENYETIDLPENPPDDLYEFSHYYWNVGLRQPVDVNVGFRFLEEYPLSLTARPNQNGILSSQQAQGNAQYLSFLCLQTYKFTYDVTFPVEVAIVQNDAFANGEPFVLRYFVPVHIESNIPTTESTGRRPQHTVETQAEFCEQTFDDSVAIYAQDTYRVQQFGNFDIRYVDFYFDCLGISCPLGQSDANGRLVAHLPASCYGGEIVATHNNIIDERVQWNNDQAVITVPTRQVMDVPVSVWLNPTDLANEALIGGQFATIQLDTADGFTGYGYVSPNEENTVNMLFEPATYNITVAVYTDNFLSGGYTGQFTVTEEEMFAAGQQGQPLHINVLNNINYPTQDDAIFELYEQLQDPATFDHRFGPRWTS